jgi:hypothetical protein
MVQVSGATYRVVRMAQGQYDVIRILDDSRVGSFKTIPRLESVADGVDDSLMAQIARAAVRGARATWAARKVVPGDSLDDEGPDEPT